MLPFFYCMCEALVVPPMERDCCPPHGSWAPALAFFLLSGWWRVPALCLSAFLGQNCSHKCIQHTASRALACVSVAAQPVRALHRQAHAWVKQVGNDNKMMMETCLIQHHKIAMFWLSEKMWFFFFCSVRWDLNQFLMSWCTADCMTETKKFIMHVSHWMHAIFWLIKGAGEVLQI